MVTANGFDYKSLIALEGKGMGTANGFGPKRLIAFKERNGYSEWI